MTLSLGSIFGEGQGALIVALGQCPSSMKKINKKIRIFVLGSKRVLPQGTSCLSPKLNIKIKLTGCTYTGKQSKQAALTWQQSNSQNLKKGNS